MNTFDDKFSKAKRLFFLRISEPMNKTHTDLNDLTKHYNQKGKAVFVFYDNGTEEPDYSVSKVRYALVLRNSLTKYLEKNYDNDSFKQHLEEKNLVSYYQERYSAVHHGLHRYVKEILKDNDLKPYTKAQAKLAYTCAQIGEKYGQFISGNSPIVYPKNAASLFTPQSFERFNDDLQIMCQLDPQQITISSDLTNGIASNIDYNTFELIIFEAMVNALKNYNYVTGTISIKISISDNGWLSIKSIGRKIEKDLIPKLKNHIYGHLPINKKLGIGLYTINCMVRECCMTNIKFNANFNNNCFELLIPLKN